MYAFFLTALQNVISV